MQRVILLGASNLTISFPLILEYLLASTDRHLSVHAAVGHGRSFGLWSRVLYRALPSILDCDLWSTLDSAEPSSAKPLALITDIGNDLVYGVSVEQVLRWVETCLERVSEHEASSVLTLLPIASIARLSWWRYHLTRLIFFPRHSVPWDEMLRRAEQLNEGLITMGRKYNAQIVEPPGEWYGFDPIHIRRSRRAIAWREILSHWSEINLPKKSPGASLKTRAIWQRLQPSHRRIFGQDQYHQQPAHYSDDLTVYLH